MLEPNEAHLAKMLDPDITAKELEDIIYIQYVALLQDGLTKETAPSVYVFFAGESDLNAYWQARGWWPTHKTLPEKLRCPTLRELTINYHNDGVMIYEGEDARIPTFLDRLTQRAHAAAKWVKQQGLDLHAADETEEQRKARLNREAQARHRERTQAKEDTPEGKHVLEVKAAYAAYMEVCAERKATVAKLKEGVDIARAKWQNLKANPPAKEPSE